MIVIHQEMLIIIILYINQYIQFNCFISFQNVVLYKHKIYFQANSNIKPYYFNNIISSINGMKQINNNQSIRANKKGKSMGTSN